MVNRVLRRMRLFQFQTVRMKTLVTLLPAFAATLALLAGFSYFYSKQVIQDQIGQQMDLQLSEISGRISSNLGLHGRTPEIVARTVEGQASAYSLKQYQAILTSAVASNPDSFGMGIYFEPYRYSADKQFFSTYIYRNGQELAATEQYSDPSYNYPEQDWYKIGMQQKGITSPYYDPGTDITMVTFSYPFFAEDRTLLGIVTGDLNLQTVQRQIDEAAVGASGWATLYDSEGNYLAGPDKDKIMKLNLVQETNSGLAQSAAELLGKDSGMTVYKEDEERYRLYHQKLAETGWVLALTVPESELFSPLRTLLVWTSLIGIAGIAVAALSVYLFSLAITRNLERVNLLSKALSEGDFTREIAISGKDEFAAMAGHLNRMTLNIRELVGKISESSLQVAAASEQLTTSAEECSRVTESVVLSIQEVASGSESQLASTRETAKAMEEMAAGVQRIVDGSLVSSRAAEAISTQAKYGSGQMREAAACLKALEEDSAQTMELIDSLGRHSGEVVQIVDFIAEISNQTNLLSLNAAIEAARAGEHGKGFAVVANEVKKLAERSTDAARTISSLIAKIQEGNANAAEVMSHNNAKVKESAELAAEAGRIFEEIQQGLGSIAAQSHEISASSEELMAGTEEITSTMDQLAQIAIGAAGHTQTVAAASQEQLASMEQVASSSADLAQMADRLQLLLARFKVG